MMWEKVDWIMKEIGYLPADDEAGIDFYYKGMHDFGLGLYDTDDYAWLNTLLGYDIGGENAKAIIDWYYVNEDTTVQEAIDVERKDELVEVADKLGIVLDFSNWPDKDPEYLEYGFEEKGA